LADREDAGRVIKHIIGFLAKAKAWLGLFVSHLQH
jgi:hypothetical protein